MTKNRLWVIGSVVVMVAIVLAGWFLGIQPQLNSTAVSELQRQTMASTNASYAAQLAKLQADNKKLPELRSRLAVLTDSIPALTDSEGFVTEANQIASQTGVTITTFNFTDAQRYQPVVALPAAPSTPAAAGGSTASPTPSPSATPSPTVTAAPVAPAPGTPPVSNLLINANNFAAIPVQITVRGTFAQALDFIKGMQTGGRLFLVTTISTTPAVASTKGQSVAGQVDTRLGGFIYSLSTLAVPVAK